MTYYIRKHEMVHGDTADYCKYCNTRSGVGFYVFTNCKLRFNENDFKKYLDFKNIGVTTVPKKVGIKLKMLNYLLKDILQKLLLEKN